MNDITGFTDNHDGSWSIQVHHNSFYGQLMTYIQGGPVPDMVDGTFPRLEFAASALWMFKEHFCTWDLHRHAIIDCGGPWNRTIEIPHLSPLTEYFYRK